MKYHSDDVVRLFNDLFRDTCKTILVQGGAEPEYIPAANADGLHRIIFSNDYFASALHEVSHWCIAGAPRRELHDYGYWYAPDGRSAGQQALFETVEVKPQALEWLFSQAAGSRFRISLDNLSGDGGSNESRFRKNVTIQARRYLEQGLPRRARLFSESLMVFYKRPEALSTEGFLTDDRVSAARQGI